MLVWNSSNKNFKRFMLFAWISLFPIWVLGQSINDCIEAIKVCSDTSIMVEGIPGFPDFNNPDNDLGCHLTPEQSSAWLILQFRDDMPINSILEFTIEPFEGETIDYDFSIYGPFPDCDSLGSPVRCSYSFAWEGGQWACGFCPLTGLGMGETDTSEDAFQNGFVAPLPVNPGEWYILYINEFADVPLSQGFHIDFGGSAADYFDCLGNPNCDMVTVNAGADTSICNTDTLQLNVITTETTGFETYTWRGGNGEEIFLSDSNAIQPYLVLPADFAGIINFIVEVANADCVHFDTLQIAVLDPPTLELSGDTLICPEAIAEVEATDGFDTYLWSDNTISPTLIVQDAGLYGVTVSYGGGTCVFSDSILVQAVDGPVLNMPDTISFCAGQNAVLSAGAGFVSYLWNDNSTNATLFINQSGMYSVTVVDGNGCAASDTTIVIEWPEPDPGIASEYMICPGGSVTVSAQSGFALYFWSTSETTESITLDQPGLYDLLVVDVNGCGSITNFEVIESTLLPLEISGDTLLCFGEESLLDAGSGYATYGWQDGAETQQLLVSDAGIYAVTVTDANGCVLTDSVEVMEIAAPVLNLPDSLGFCDGLQEVLFAGFGFDSYEWSTTSINPSITVTDAGTYSVTVSNAAGCTASDTTLVAVYADPDPGLEAIYSICSGEPALVEATPGYILYEWSTMDEDTASISIDVPGDYSLLVIDSNGCGAIVNFEVEEHVAPVVDVLGVDAVCPGETSLLMASPGFENYLWQDGSENPGIAASETGTYSVTATDINGCQAVDSLVFTIYPSPSLNLPDSSFFCQGDQVVLQAPSGLISYQWSDASSDPSLVVSNGGQYSLTVTDGNQCSAADTVQVIEYALPDILLEGPLNICNDQTTTLTLVGAFDSIAWSSGGSSSSETFSLPGSYQITVTDANGCSNETAFQIGQLMATPVTIIGNNPVCEGQPVTLDAGSGFMTYNWSTGDTTQQTTVINAGEVIVQVMDDQGCMQSDTVQVMPAEYPVLDLPATIGICENANSVELNPFDPGQGEYLWSTMETTTSITVFSPGFYSVTVTNAIGCSTSDTIEVVEEPAPLPTIIGDLTLCPDQFTVLQVVEPFQTYLWSTGDTTSSITVYDPGTYQVTVNNVSNCPNYVNVLVLPLDGSDEVDIEAYASFCPGDSLTVTVQTTHFSYLWSNSSTSNEITVYDSGTYSVTVSNFWGCTATDSILVEVLPEPETGLMDQAAICDGDTATLAGTAGFLSYTWNTGAITESIEVSDPGWYVLEVADLNGCIGIDSVEVVERSSPVTAIVGNDRICPGDSSLLSVSGTWPQVLWGGGENSAAIYASEPGDYSVVVTDEFGCTASATAQVGMYMVESPSIDGAAGLCPDSTTVLQVIGDYVLYNWDTGQEGATLLIDSPGEYEVVVTDQNGCRSTASFEVQAFTQPDVDISGDPVVCWGELVQLEGPSGFSQYEWSTGHDEKDLTASSAGFYTLLVTDQNGCSAMDSIEVIWNALPDVAILGEQQFCEGDYTVLEASSVFPVFQWNTGSTLASTQVNTAGMVTLTVSDDNGCSGADTIQVTAIPLPVPQIPTVEGICLGNATTLTVTDDFDTYQWSTDEETAMIEVTQAGWYWVTVSDGFGCNGTDSIFVAVYDLPELMVEGATTFCEGNSILLSAISNADSLVWQDGTLGTVLEINSTGTYTVTAFDENGCNTQASLDVAAISMPNADPGANQTLNCEVDAVQLGSPEGGSAAWNYYWSGPGINASNQSESNPWVTEPGIYFLITEDAAFLCLSDTAWVMVEDISYEPEIALAVMDTLDCNTSSVSLMGEGSATGAAIIYQWYNGGGAVIPDAASINLQVTSPGNYTLQVIDTVANCMSEASVLVSANFNGPEVEIGEAETLTCVLTDQTLSAAIEAAGAVEILWTTDTGLILAGQASAMAQIGAPGWYYIWVTELETGCIAVDSILILADTMAPVANAGTDQEIDCTQTEVVLDGTGSSQGSQYTYTWVSENGIMATQTLTPIIDQGGAYELTVTNEENGCTASDVVEVSENDSFIQSVQLDAIDPLCFEDENGAIRVNGIGGGSPPYLFSLNGAAFAEQQFFTGLGAGQYTLIVQDAVGCEYELEITLEEPEEVLLELGDDQTIDIGGSVQLVALTTILEGELEKIVWNGLPDSINCFDCLDVEVSPLLSTIYTATVTDLNGCSATDIVRVFVDKARYVYIPNVFSPNGDGANDEFYIFGGPDVEEIVQLSIFDRWGESLFTMENFPPNDPHYGWNGTFRGKPLHSDVFVYFAEIRFKDGAVILYKGDVNLIR
ncbi:MAG TPA: gliding motility-associated C-terminal domain-containing protein [Saprospiraceae bacterium]|nr:gliding motility-associated C-terminal domain-containing protein [Saprospiraceae bacterium]